MFSNKQCDNKMYYVYEAQNSVTKRGRFWKLDSSTRVYNPYMTHHYQTNTQVFVYKRFMKKVFKACNMFRKGWVPTHVSKSGLCLRVQGFNLTCPTLGYLLLPVAHTCVSK